MRQTGTLGLQGFFIPTGITSMDSTARTIRAGILRRGHLPYFSGKRALGLTKDPGLLRTYIGCEESCIGPAAGACVVVGIAFLILVVMRRALQPTSQSSFPSLRNDKTDVILHCSFGLEKSCSHSPFP